MDLEHEWPQKMVEKSSIDVVLKAVFDYPPKKIFDRTRRLRSSAEFKNTFKQAIKIHTPVVSFYLKKNTLVRARLGVVVPKKRVKTAVLRNKIKRVLREQFRHHQNQLVGWDLIVMVNHPVNNTLLVKVDKLLIQPWEKLQKYYQES